MTIKVAVLGVGEHARRNTLPALNECNAVKLIGLYGRNIECSNKESKKYNCIVYSEPVDMLSDTQIDVIYIALPVGMHAEWGQRVIQAGKHLWCEKSLTHENNITNELISEAQKRDLSVCECFMYTHHPMFERLKQYMNNMHIGTIRSITAKFGFPHIASNNIRYSKELGGGALLDNGCYPLHAVRQLAGSMPIRINSNLIYENNYDVDTMGTALLEFKSGLQAHLEWGFGHSYVNEIELWGENGIAKAKMIFSKPISQRSTIDLIDTAGKIKTEVFPESNHFIEMFSNFSSACSDSVLRKSYWNDAIQQSTVMENIRNH